MAGWLAAIRPGLRVPHGANTKHPQSRSPKTTTKTYIHTFIKRNKILFIFSKEKFPNL
jgi:hypothetical protein